MGGAGAAATGGTSPGPPPSPPTCCSEARTESGAGTQCVVCEALGFGGERQRLISPPLAPNDDDDVELEWKAVGRLRGGGGVEEPRGWSPGAETRGERGGGVRDSRVRLLLLAGSSEEARGRGMDPCPRPCPSNPHLPPAASTAADTLLIGGPGAGGDGV